MPGETHEGKKTLGGFELISLLGRGGMGAVYKARQASLDRLVALKVLSPSLARNRDFIMRFLREAQSAGRLNHPNIVTGIDVGEADGYFYFAMEYVDGESLGARLAREGNIAPKEAVALVRQVAEGLRHAHEHGLIHRDVKPENVLVDSRGTAKLCDLGLARATGADDSSLTQTGTALGTPNYISPEQARGDGDVDARTDIYSLGASLYHLIAGSPPYEGKTSAVVLSKHLKDPVPQLVRIAPSAGHNVSAVVAKCMQKSAADRYESMAELIDDLDLVLAGRPPRAVGLRTLGQRTRARAAGVTGATHATSPLAPVSRRARGAGSTSIFEAARSRPWVLVTAGTILMVLCAAAAWAFTRSGRGPEQTRTTPPEKPPETPPGVPTRPSGPDHGKLVADARAYWAAHPRNFEKALDRARKASATARGTKWWIDADKLVQEVTSARKEAADAALADMKKRADAAAAAGDYDGAIAVWAKPPLTLAAFLRDRTAGASAELRRAAETRLGGVLREATDQLAAGRPDEGLKKLAAADAVRYAAWAPKFAALRTQLEKARDDATERARLAKLASARRKLDGYLDAFDAKGASGDFAAARKTAAKAAADPELKGLAAEVAALGAVAEGLGKAAAARRNVLLDVKRKGRQTFMTPQGWVSGTITKIGDEAITVSWTSRVGSSEKVRSKDIRIADVGGKLGERLKGAFHPASPAEHLAEAVRACAARDAAAMSAAMKAAAGHPLQPRWQPRLDPLLLGAADALAKAAWEALKANPRAAPGYRLDEKSAGELLAAIDGYEAAHGKTKFAASVAGEIAALRGRARSVMTAWLKVPAKAIQVLVKGGARVAHDEAADVLSLTIPHDGKAMVPLVANARDYSLKFQYRGPGVEMFARRDGGHWRGCVLALLGEKTTRIRYYPTEEGGQNAQDITASGKRRGANSWHTVETTFRGSSLLLKVDGEVVSRRDDLAAVSRGDTYLLGWDTRGGALQIRRVEIAVADKDIATSPDGGIARGFALRRDRDGEWIEVQADGGGATETYRAMPMAGGSNPMTVEALKKIFGPNRVTVIWKPLRGERRIAAIWRERPEADAGATTGAVSAVHIHESGRYAQFDLKPDNGGPVYRYSPRWRGGMPRDGGGPERAVVDAIKGLKPGQRVRVQWIFETRMRAVKIERVQ